MNPLLGRVAPVWPTERTTPDATTLAHHACIVTAAQAYVAALLAWNEQTKWDDHKRRELHRAQKALVDAVEQR